MSNYGQLNLARLRPDKLDDTFIQEQISIIQKTCENVNPDIIAMVFHECDYNLQNTIQRIQAGDYEDGGWQTATKSNHKKKPLSTDQLPNGGGGIQSDSLSQRTSPTSSLPSGINGHRRQEQYSHGRRGGMTNFDRKHVASSHSTNKSLTNPTKIISPNKPKENPTLPTFTFTDELELNSNITQSLISEKNDNKSLLVTSATKRPSPSSIPQEPVSMHRTIQFSTEPIDIQFGDIQWKDSIPIKVTPSTSPTLGKSLDDQSSSSSLMTIIQSTDVQKPLLSNFTNPETTNETNRKLSEITHQLSLDNNHPSSIIIPSESTSHLSDELTHPSQEQSTTPLPTYVSDTLSNTFLSSNTSSGNNPSTVASPSNFQPICREYSQTSMNTKTTSKPTMIQTGAYPPQASYSIQPHQQFFLGHYPYPTPVYPVITPVEPWSTAGYETYPTYQTTSYMPTYPTQQQYQSPTTPPIKYVDPYAYDKEFFANYGQTRSSNPDLSNSSQTTKDSLGTSKLSATAASFSQGVPLTATSPTATYVINPSFYTIPAYHSFDNRDNRNGASYTGHPNRSHYQQQQQQQHQQQQQAAHYRTHHNSNWYSQQ